MNAHPKIITAYHQGIVTAVSQLNQQHTTAHPDGFIPPQMSQTMHWECQRFNPPFFSLVLVFPLCFSSPAVSSQHFPQVLKSQCHLLKLSDTWCCRCWRGRGQHLNTVTNTWNPSAGHEFSLSAQTHRNELLSSARLCRTSLNPVHTQIQIQGRDLSFGRNLRYGHFSNDSQDWLLEPMCRLCWRAQVSNSWLIWAHHLSRRDRKRDIAK